MLDYSAGTENVVSRPPAGRAQSEAKNGSDAWHKLHFMERSAYLEVIQRETTRVALL
jgi:hypothetical protein